MQARARFELYERVPDGSILEVWAEGNAGVFTTGGKVIDGTDATGDVEWGHATLYRPSGSNAAGRLLLQTPRAYIVTITTAFQQAGTATITTQILKTDENGNPILDPNAGEPVRHGEPYTWEFVQQAGALELCGLFIKTLKQ